MKTLLSILCLLSTPSQAAKLKLVGHFAFESTSRKESYSISMTQCKKVDKKEADRLHAQYKCHDTGQKTLDRAAVGCQKDEKGVHHEVWLFKLEKTCTGAQEGAQNGMDGES